MRVGEVIGVEGTEVAVNGCSAWPAGNSPPRVGWVVSGADAEGEVVLARFTSDGWREV